MDYKLSNKNDDEKRKLEESINEKIEKIKEIEDEIELIKENKSENAINKTTNILEKNIQIAELKNEKEYQESLIQEKYINEIKDKIVSKRKNQEISIFEFGEDNQNIFSLYRLISEHAQIKFNENESDILEMKIQLLKRKVAMNLISPKIAEQEIKELQEKIDECNQSCEVNKEYIIDEQYKYNKRKLVNQRNNDEITSDEYNKELTNIEDKKNEIIDVDSMKSEFEKMCEKYLDAKEERNNTYENNYSARSRSSVAAALERMYNQDIDSIHNDEIYHNGAQQVDRISFEYGLEYDTNSKMDYTDFVATKLSDQYTRYEGTDKSDMIKDFAKLEAKGIYSGYSLDDAKFLLQFEKVDGIQYDYREAVHFQNVLYQESPIHNVNTEVYIATYEKKQYDATTGKDVMVPIKEYYTKGENGELELIASSEDKEFEGIKVNVGKSIEKISQKDMADRLIKNDIEDSLRKGKVGNITQITDHDFLEDLREQCGFSDGDYPIDKVFIATTINEKGEEEFNLVTAFPNYNGFYTEYKQFEGMQVAKENGREVLTTTNRSVGGGLTEFETVKTLKEFVTKSGNRYAITRNEKGELGFSELPRENEKGTVARHVDTYSLAKSYENAEINEQDLGNARKTLERTKGEREGEKNFNEFNKEEK